MSGAAGKAERETLTPEEAWRERFLDIRRPADGVRVGRIPVEGAERVRQVVASVRRVQEGWAGLTPRDRIRRLSALRTLLGRRADEVADRILAETSRPEGEALAEVLSTMRWLRFVERRGPALLSPRRITPFWFLGRRSWIVREPAGVVGVIGAGSAPFSLCLEPVFAALAGGNGVVLKPSARAPFTGDFVRELVEDAGLPEGLVGVVHGRAATGEALVDADIDHLHFSGHGRIATEVRRKCAMRGTPVTLFSGGPGQGIVLPGADPEEVARGIIHAAFREGGDRVGALATVFAVEEEAEALERALVRHAEALRPGAGGEVDVGPLPSAEAVAKLEEVIGDAVGRGARTLTGGNRVDPASNVFLPTILGDLAPGARMLRENVPGPLLGVLRVRDLDGAIQAANAVPAPLAATLWGPDPVQARAVGARLTAGAVGIGAPPDPLETPALSLGQGGWGRMRGEEGLLSFTRSRTVTHRRRHALPPLHGYPYGPTGRRLLRARIGWEGYRGLRGIVAALIRAFDREDR